VSQGLKQIPDGRIRHLDVHINVTGATSGLNNKLHHSGG